MAKKILIVDDDQDLRKGLGIRLKANGYEVSFAADAYMAVKETREKEPDLIILDLGLPGGDGFLVMERLSNLLLVDASIIVYSARDVEGNEEKALNAGAVAYFQKPADDEELLDAIRKALGE